MVSLELYSLGQLNSVLAPNHLLLDMMLDVVNNNKNCELCLMYVCSPYSPKVYVLVLFIFKERVVSYSPGFLVK